MPEENMENVGHSVCAVGGGYLVAANSFKMWVPCSYIEHWLHDYMDIHRYTSTNANNNTDYAMYSVLLVESSEKLRDNLVELFAKYNCDVATCVNGQEGLTRLLHDSPYDLVIVDFLMPCINGFETIQMYHEQNLRVVGEEIIVGLLNPDETFSDFVPSNYSEHSAAIVDPKGHFDYIFQKPLDDDVVKMLFMKAREVHNKRTIGNRNKSK
jgi:CheY-like chemotaxis protein